MVLICYKHGLGLLRGILVLVSLESICIYLSKCELNFKIGEWIVIRKWTSNKVSEGHLLAFVHKRLREVVF